MENSPFVDHFPIGKPWNHGFSTSTLVFPRVFVLLSDVHRYTWSPISLRPHDPQFGHFNCRCHGSSCKYFNDWHSQFIGRVWITVEHDISPLRVPWQISARRVFVIKDMTMDLILFCMNHDQLCLPHVALVSDGIFTGFSYLRSVNAEHASCQVHPTGCWIEICFSYPPLVLYSQRTSAA